MSLSWVFNREPNAQAFEKQKGHANAQPFENLKRDGED